MPSDVDRRAKFIDAYARTGKGTESAIEAGYSRAGARVHVLAGAGHRLELDAPDEAAGAVLDFLA